MARSKLAPKMTQRMVQKIKTPRFTTEPRKDRQEFTWDPPVSFCTQDNESDNNDVLVEIDPDNILTVESRLELGILVARAMCKAKFEPEVNED